MKVTLKSDALGSGQGLLSSAHPFKEFFDFSRLSCPSGDGPVICERLEINFWLYRVNYLIIFGLFTLYCMFSNFGFALLVIAFMCTFYWITYCADFAEPIRGYNVRLHHAYAGLALITFMILVFTNAGAHCSGPFCMTATLIVLHALFRTPDPDITPADVRSQFNNILSLW